MKSERTATGGDTSVTRRHKMEGWWVWDGSEEDRRVFKCEDLDHAKAILTMLDKWEGASWMAGLVTDWTKGTVAKIVWYDEGGRCWVDHEDQRPAPLDINERRLLEGYND